MHPFAYRRVDTIEAALRATAAGHAPAFIAGGTDLMQLMKEGAAAPAQIIDINPLQLREISVGPQGLRLGALARMADVAGHDGVRTGYPVIAEALLASASAQVRNMASIGGNLLQRTRCPYFRDPPMPCNKREPGSGCSAIGGDNRLHAIFGASAACVATHPSDFAVALVALDAEVLVQGPGGERRISIGDFHRLPGDHPERDTVLEQDELILAIHVPASAAAERSSYLKIRDRASFEFALVSVAAAMVVTDGRIEGARLAAGGVAHKPWRLAAAESALVGRPAEAGIYAEAADRAVEGASPLSMNGFKVKMLRAAVRRVLASLGEPT